MKKILCLLLWFLPCVIYSQNNFEKFWQKANQQYERFKQNADKNYSDFKDRANQQYAEFMERAWRQYNAFAGIETPKEEPVPPVVMPEEDRNKPVIDNNKLIEDVIKPQPVTPQPEPVEPIKEDKQEDKGQTFTFQFYGTDIKAPFFDNYKYKLDGVSEKQVADGWKTLSLPKYNHLINECLKIRKDYRLNDWAYLQMLDNLSVSIMNKQCNEATLLMAYLYCQSGYKMRIGESDNKLYMLYATQSTVYGVSYYVVDADIYYLYKGDKVEYIRICQAAFPQEQEMSFQLRQQPVFAMQTSSYRTLQSEYYPEIKANVRVNKNLINFYNNYPTSFINGDFGTRWAMYANTPLSDEAKNTLYPALKKVLQGKSKAESAEMLLNFVQTSLVYEYDDVVWGDDRAFFAEETLFYPYADCEDRAILYSRLVRDLLGIDAVLIYYPGHLATAICLNSPDVKGYYFIMENKRYYIADPTYIGAPIGLQMPEVRNEQIKVILLDN
ncbi:MAG: hypothetical protein J6P44_09155 [Bacteroidales bacterium]|nr:hypothetical protein [Bacteroidales bacterium]